MSFALRPFLRKLSREALRDYLCALSIDPGDAIPWEAKVEPYLDAAETFIRNHGVVASMPCDNCDSCDSHAVQYHPDTGVWGMTCPEAGGAIRFDKGALARYLPQSHDTNKGGRSSGVETTWAGIEELIRTGSFPNESQGARVRSIERYYQNILVQKPPAKSTIQQHLKSLEERIIAQMKT